MIPKIRTGVCVLACVWVNSGNYSGIVRGYVVSYVMVIMVMCVQQTFIIYYTTVTHTHIYIYIYMHIQCDIDHKTFHSHTYMCVVWSMVSVCVCLNVYLNIHVNIYGCIVYMWCRSILYALFFFACLFVMRWFLLLQIYFLLSWLLYIIALIALCS